MLSLLIVLLKKEIQIIFLYYRVLFSVKLKVTGHILLMKCLSNCH